VVACIKVRAKHQIFPGILGTDQMTNVVNVVVTCTKDKRHPVAGDCQLRNVLGESVLDRIEEWQSRTGRYWKNSVRVADLYAGDHWANVRRMESSRFGIDIWVCSAGFGLIHFDDHVAPYAATFSPNHPDSVAARLPKSDRFVAPEHWWKATASKWKSKFRNRPRSLTELAVAYPNRSLLVVASDNYMRAIAEDLREGVSRLADPDQLSIVSAGVKKLGGLDQNLIPCDARMQAILGGARRSLNTRLAAMIIRECRQPPRASILRKQYRKLLDKQPPIEKYTRQQLSDNEIKTFIRKQLVVNPDWQHSPMLRVLRDLNMACEQKRFANLYREVVETLDG
jgi:hypothetical protein